MGVRTIVSWNVNGIRAIQNKGFADWLGQQRPDILCVQETKAAPDQLTAEVMVPHGYQSLWVAAQRRGYSGVATYFRQEPLEVELGLGCPEFDVEGRTLILHYPDLCVLNCYFPNSQEEGARIAYKVAFCEAVLDRCNRLVGSGRDILLCGDYNIAHSPIDLENPKANERNPGYLPQERAWMDRFVAAGYVDTFRLFCSEPGHYTWWSYRFHAREKNVGWRIDYHCVNERSRGRVRESTILAGVMGSDHCPVRIVLD
jgi:exodeoxyribonuclease-3